jgi:uncharacterized membrane protein YphA (DoxX/SURF4 family)
MSYDPTLPGPLARYIGLIPLRLIAGITLLHMHGWTEGIAGWNHFWSGESWDSIAILEKAQMPWPRLLAIASAFITAFTGASWILGFATRFASFIFLPVALGALLVANRATASVEHSYAAETCVLYFLVALTLLVSGSGWLSIDAIFNAMRDRSKSKETYER